MAEQDKVMIKLQSSDGMEYEVEEHTAEQSAFLQGLMMSPNARENRITIPDVNGTILAKVMDYCKKHAETADKVELDSWDAAFIDVENHILYDLIMAANTLIITSLLHLCGKKFAELIKGHTADEIRATFHIQNDFTPEEVEAVRRENLWEF
ncbi:S-phase kinase-associated protein 1 [Dioscorea alata]|uniref:S-phase kinase-associated protein 1 n=2 Tax=Dioscorea alata TaxID=55571 RepID=A0ACB7V6B8_DIOAL|nr:S-phase kinase-associated protein 1 [Dioscorea alata]KAH7668963.1 S-phase kinase-associated protein 1 [Dioscorea alata]